jgi:hypothetical protein
MHRLRRGSAFQVSNLIGKPWQAPGFLIYFSTGMDYDGIDNEMTGSRKLEMKSTLTSVQKLIGFVANWQCPRRNKMENSKNKIMYVPNRDAISFMEF